MSLVERKQAADRRAADAEEKLVRLAALVKQSKEAASAESGQSTTEEIARLKAVAARNEEKLRGLETQLQGIAVLESNLQQSKTQK